MSVLSLSYFPVNQSFRITPVNVNIQTAESRMIPVFPFKVINENGV